MQGHRPPLAADVVLRAVRPPHHRSAQGGPRGGLEQLAGQGLHGVVVGVGLVRLQHGEFRVVGGVRALVAEDPADLVDALQPAHDEPLEVELQGDPQVQVDVVGVHVGRERPGVGAAVQGLQDRRLDLEIAALVQFLPDGAGDGRADLRHLAGLRIRDQVQVALPDPGLRVAQAPVLVRQRPQRLGRDGVGVGQDRQLAAARGDHLAGHPDVIADVHVLLPGRERVRADAVQRDHHLELAGAVPDRREAELAAVAAQHDPAGHARPLAGGGVGGQVRVALAELLDGVRARVADRVGVGPGGAEPVQLAQPDLHLLGDGLGRPVARRPGLLGHLPRLPAGLRPPYCARR